MPKPALGLVEVLVELVDRGLEEGLVDLPSPGQGVLCLQPFTDPPGDPGDLVTAVPPGIREPLQDLGEGRLTVTRLVGEVRACEERLAVVVEEHRHRPAAVARHRGRRGHVDGVDVGPLLAVDLDVHEVPVHQGGGRLVLEGLVGHDVAPVAGGVTDAQQNGCITTLRLGERLGSPLPPIDRIVRVLEQVWARCIGEAVGHFL